ncbi:MAG TPA: ACT domain-containing protein [Clostridiaceae bacterium]|jgi:chorismate mutase|nr:ACT domain-containing protein [Clostridiaceae bacterium]
MARQRKEPEQFYLVRADVLPEVFLKVMEVKRLLDLKLVSSVNEAVKRVGLSRSAYYKYRKAIRSTSSGTEGEMATLLIIAENLANSLPRCLDVLLEAETTIVTFHQSVPVDGLIHLLVTFRTDKMNVSMDHLIHIMTQTRGVQSVRVLISPS